MSDIKKPETWAEGRRKIDWVRANMPLKPGPKAAAR